MEKWFRITLFATAAMNILGAAGFVPANRPIREAFGLPDAPPFYLWVFAVWIFGFGICYLWMALKQSRERLFIVIGAIGKLSFFSLMLIFAIAGEFPLRAPLAVVGDLIFGILFLIWLLKDAPPKKAEFF
jgi:hypothetical protein